jgi:hypothetical protein
MYQFTIIKSDAFNNSIFEFCTKLKSHKKTYQQAKELIFKFYDVLNVKLDYFNPYEVQEVNNCLLIYCGLDHLLTIKIDL